MNNNNNSNKLNDLNELPNVNDTKEIFSKDNFSFANTTIHLISVDNIKKLLDDATDSRGLISLKCLTMIVNNYRYLAKKTQIKFVFLKS